MFLVSLKSCLLLLFILLVFVIFSAMSAVFSQSTTDQISYSKASPFECGFDSKSSSRSPFSLRFFLLCIVFLVFDVEIALIFPLVLGLSLSESSAMVCVVFFYSILLLGLFYEWMIGSLSWVK